MYFNFLLFFRTKQILRVFQLINAPNVSLHFDIHTIRSVPRDRIFRCCWLLSPAAACSILSRAHMFDGTLCAHKRLLLSAFEWVLKSSQFDHICLLSFWEQRERHIHTILMYSDASSNAERLNAFLFFVSSSSVDLRACSPQTHFHLFRFVCLEPRSRRIYLEHEQERETNVTFGN